VKLKPGQTRSSKRRAAIRGGSALAMVCAQKGYPLVVTMAEPFARGRKMMRFLGGEGG